MSRAATELHLAQPAVSQAIAQLERYLGVELLVRHKRGVELTDAGREFVEDARATVEAAERAAERAKGWARASVAEIVVGFLPGMFALMEPVLSAFGAACPDVRLIPRELNFAQQLDELRVGRVDVEFVLAPPTAPDLAVRPVAAVPRIVLLSSRHRLSGRPMLAFDEIADERLPGRHPAVSEEWTDTMWMTARRGRRPDVTRETPLTTEELWLLLISVDVVAICPACLAASRPRPRVAAVPLLDAEPLTVGIAQRADDERPGIVGMLDLAFGDAPNAAG